MVCLCNFRYFILAILFLVNVSNPLCCRNMIYAIQPMLNHTALEGRYYDEQHRTNDVNSETGLLPTARNASFHKCHFSEPTGAEERDDDRHYVQQGRRIKDGPYLYGDRRQAAILSVLAFGQLFGTLFALLIYDYCYLGPVLVISLAWIGCLNLSLPLIAHKAGSVGVMISRFSVGLYVGLLTPTNNLVCATWFPVHEKAFALTIVSAGQNMGAVLFALSGLVNDWLGWQALFWLPGFLPVLCSLLVAIFYNDDPSNNGFLSEKERRLLDPSAKPRQMKLATSKFGAGGVNVGSVKFRPRSAFQRFHVAIARASRRRPAPWFKALGYPQYWAVLAGTFGHAWASEATITYTQIYLTEIHHYTLAKASFLNSVPTNLSMLLFGLFGSKLGETCIERQTCQKITVRRIGGLFLASTGVYFLLLGVLPCPMLDSVIIPLLIMSSFRAGTFVSILPSFLDISPTYQDTLVTLSMVIGFIPGFIVPGLIGMVGKETRREWLELFIISAVIIFCSVGFYVVLIRPKVQEFDDVAMKQQQEQEQQQARSSDEDEESLFDVKSTLPRKKRPTPATAVDFAKANWPSGKANVNKSVWDLMSSAAVNKLVDRAKKLEEESPKSPKKKGGSKV